MFGYASRPKTLIYLTVYGYQTRLTDKKHKLLCRVLLEHEGEPLLGKRGARIPDIIGEMKSVSKTVNQERISCRCGRNYAAEIEKTLQKPVVHT
jgi:molybdenum-dependent DNA-binding transcriptional regulator ModE